MIIVYYWTDGTWCYKDEYSEAEYGWKSDDFAILEVLEYISDAAIDKLVFQKIS